MPFDTDGKDLKAIIAALYPPPLEAGGKLSGIFSVDSRSESTALQGSQKLDIHNLGMAFASNGDTSGPSFILTGSQAALRNARFAQHEHRQQEEQSVDLALSQARADLAARLAALDAELAAIDARMAEIVERCAAIGESMDALQDIDDLVASGKLDPNNPAHAALLRKAGIDPDSAHDNDDWAEIIRQRREELSREDGGLDSEWNDLLARRGRVAKRRGDIADALADISQADTEEAKYSALQHAQTVAGVRALGGAAFETDDEGRKLIAADAVGVSAKSEEYNQQAATDKENFVSTNDELDWEDTKLPAPIGMKS